MEKVSDTRSKCSYEGDLFRLYISDSMLKKTRTIKPRSSRTVDITFIATNPDQYMSRRTP